MKASLRLLAVLGMLLALHAAAPAGARTYFQLGGSKGTFTPGKPVRIALHANTKVEVEAAVVALTSAEVIALERRGASKNEVLALLESRRPVRATRRRIVPENEQGDHEIVFTGLPRGLYGLRLRSGDETVTHIINVTTLGLTIQDTGSNLAVYALDLISLQGRNDVSYEFYRPDNDTPETRAPGGAAPVLFERVASDGVRESTVFVARGGDGSVVVARPPQVSSEPSITETAYLQTDRPIYRPGHHVMYRAIVRTGMPGAFSLPTGERIVRLADPNGKTVSTFPRPYDAFGTLQGEFTLAEDAALGTYRLLLDGDHPAASASFAVEAYKKPEYLVEVKGPRTVVGGERPRFEIAARYFFGRPVAGMKLHYRASFRPSYMWWRRGAPFSFRGFTLPQPETPAQVEGNLTADAAGHASVALATQSVSTETTLFFEVDGRDESGRTVTAERRTQVTPAALFLTVSPNSYFVNAGDPVDVTVRSIAYATGLPRPQTAVTLTFERVYWDGSHVQRDALDTKELVTDARGQASVRWQPPRGGYVQIRARSRDEAGREATTTASVWVPEKRYEHPYVFDTVTVVPQKAEYAPGEPAQVLVTVPRGDVDALVHVSSGAGDRLFVRRLTTQTTVLAVDAPPSVARYRVTVDVPTAAGITSADAVLNVVPPPHKLRVAIRAAKAKYEPGERARFAIAVQDQTGNPVRAQIGLAVVDDAIFALRPASNGDPFDAFYGSPGPYRRGVTTFDGVDAALSGYLYQPLLRIGRTVSRSSTSLVPGTAADAYSVNMALAAPAPPTFDQLRSDFRDTAYWAPAVVTGNDGRAVVTFDWPDSLTSYTAAGVAVSQGSDVGSGSGAALVTKDFLVRLGAPRFLRSGDAAQITGIAQGTRGSKSARLRFSAPELGVADEMTTARFDARALATVHWNVRGAALGSSSLRLAGTSGSLRDGMRIAVPVEAAGTPEHERAAGMLPAAAELALKLRRGAQAGDLRIDLAPSALAQLVADVRLLQVYPYYCVEQTMSAALPAIYIDRLRKRIKLPPPEGPAPAQVAKRAVDRLVKLQHRDGSWGWWEHDAANPFMTAYALYGLAELAHEGYEVPASTLSSGATSVVGQLAASGDTLAFWGGPQPNSEWNTRAYMLFALADAAPERVDRSLLAKTDAHVADLNSYALSVLGLAHLELKDRGGAQPLLDELLRRVSDDGSSAQWKGQGWHYRWQDDPIETTAYALRFVHAMTPDDPRVGHAINWLRAQQHGSWFVTTKDTAAAIYAMSEAIPVSSSELDPHETIRITLDGRLVKSVRIDAPVLSRADASIRVPGGLLARGGTLRFEREGTGSLAWSTDWTQYVHDPDRSELDPTFNVTRSYSTAGGSDWHVGDRIDVDLTVTPKSDSQYVAIEDPLPAGLEYQPKQHQSGDDWSGLQFFDDRVVFFATRIWARQAVHLRYTLRATTAGSFTAPAPTAYAMYGPPVAASGKPAHVTIR